jgi:hypothetical protein
MARANDEMSAAASSTSAKYVPSAAKKAFITGQDGSCLSELLLEKGCRVQGIIRCSSWFNTDRIDHLYRGAAAAEVAPERGVEIVDGKGRHRGHSVATDPASRLMGIELIRCLRSNWPS